MFLSLFKDLIQFANDTNDDFTRLQVLRILEVLISGDGYISPASIAGKQQHFLDIDWLTIFFFFDRFERFLTIVYYS